MRAVSPRLAWGLALVVLVLWAFGDVLGVESGLLYRDHMIAFRPRWQAIHDALAAGELPTLTRASRGDIPLEVLLNGAYTPMTALLFVGGFDVGYDLLVAGFYVLLAVGAYLLASDLGAAPHEAFAVGSFGALAGPVLSLENLLAMLQGLAWFPWVLWAFRRALIRKGRARVAWAALFGLLAGFQLQSLVPPVAYLDGVGGALVLLRERRRVSARGLAAVAGGAVLAFGVACVDLFPTLEFLASTRRAAGLDYAERARWQLLPRELLELVVPAFWWSPAEGLYTLSDPAAEPGRPEFPLLLSLYMGTGLTLGLVAVLAALGALARPPRTEAGAHVWTLGLGLLFVLAVLVAMGTGTPLHRGVSSLPLLTQSRFPPKYLCFAVAAAAGLLPFALRRIAASRAILLPVSLLTVGGLLALTLGIRSEAFAAWVVDAVAYRTTFVPVLGIGRPELAGIALEAMGAHVAFALLGAGGLVLVAAVPPERAPSLRPRLVAALVGVELAAAAGFALVPGDVAASRLPPEVAGRLAREGPVGLYLASAWAPTPPIRPRPGERSLLAAGMRAHNERGANPYGQGVFRAGDLDAEGFSHPLSPAGLRWMKRVGPPEAYRLAARLGIDWLATFRPLPGLETQVMTPPGEAPHFFGRVPEPERLDRVSVWTRWHAVPAEATVEAVADAIQRGEAPGLPVVLGDPPGDCADDPRVREARDRLDRVALTVTSTCATLVRLQQVRHHGWVARVDGARAPLDTADFGVMAVRVPPGTHRVVLAYEARAPAWWPLWCASLIVAALGLVVGWAPGPRPPRRSPEPSAEGPPLPEGRDPMGTMGARRAPSPDRARTGACPPRPSSASTSPPATA